MLGSNCYRLLVKQLLPLTPSMWVLANVSPVHAKQTLNMYGLGLSVTSTEGREQKHQMIKKYANNTMQNNKWPMILRHEYLQLVYLREHGFDRLSYKRKQQKFFLDFADDCYKKCGLRMDNSNKCSLCASVKFNKILKTYGQKL